MSTAKVVVTGAGGHLGRAVVVAIEARGSTVVAPPRSEVDLEHDDAVAALARQLGPDVSLVHLAAWHPPATATTNAVDRRRLLACNVLGTMRALEAARVAGVASVTYASTFEVYGLPEAPGPVTESARLNPVTDYGATKLAGEDHLLAFAYEQKTRVVALRFPAIYGPGERTARALPNFLGRVLRGEVPSIFGSGDDLRDQIHVRDAALAVECSVFGSASGVFNVADGEPHSITELAQTAMRVAAMTGQPRYEPLQKTRYDFHMSIEKARRELGFEPRILLEQGMAEQLEWLRSDQAS